jgi:sarcosine oxidase subunit gamma
MATPEAHGRRSPLYRKLNELGASFDPLNDFAAAQSCGRDVLDETAQARMLGLADLTPLPRVGFKGWNIGPWLAAQGAKVGDASNRAYPQADGTRIARLAPSEVIVLGDRLGDGPLVESLDKAWAMEAADGCFRVAREEASCCLLICGGHAVDMFAKICAVDLRPDAFKPNAIAQTNIARLNAIVVRDDIGAVPAFDLLTDIASAAYLWDALLDAMDEYGGTPIGLAAIRSLTQEKGA